MTAQGEVHGEPFLDRIFKNGTATADKKKPVFRKVEKPKAAANKPTILRLAVTDAHTSETGQHLKSVGLEVTIDGKKQDLPAQFIGGDVFRVEIPAQAAGKTIKVKPVRTTDRARQRPALARSSRSRSAAESREGSSGRGRPRAPRLRRLVVPSLVVS